MGDRRRTILVVDDDEAMLEMVEMMLRETGCDVVTAANGAKALEAVEKRMPDLIVLDLVMPVMNGWQFASEFKVRYGDQVPIIVLTATNDAEGSAERIGAVGSLQKPFNLDQLVEMVGSCVEYLPSQIR